MRYKKPAVNQWG